MVFQVFNDLLLPNPQPPTPKVPIPHGHVLLTNAPNTGKSHHLLIQCRQWLAQGALVAGWVAPGVFWESKKIGHDIIFFNGSNETTPTRFTRTEPFDRAFQYRRYWFDQTVFDRAETVVSQQAAVFVIDEVGPLELDEGRGFWPVLQHVYNKFPNTVTVVREACVEKLSAISFQLSARS